jgi:TRAF3-interacting protein 1
VKKTLATLGSVVEAPALTEKLLSRPPFRFIFDVVAEVTAQTGFLAGELPGMPSDKAGRVEYVTELIGKINALRSGVVDADPLKIIAGLDPEKTNVLLQELHAAAAAAAAKTES